MLITPDKLDELTPDAVISELEGRGLSAATVKAIVDDLTAAAARERMRKALAAGELGQARRSGPLNKMTRGRSSHDLAYRLAEQGAGRGDERPEDATIGQSVPEHRRVVVHFLRPRQRRLRHQWQPGGQRRQPAVMTLAQSVTVRSPGQPVPAMLRPDMDGVAPDTRHTVHVTCLLIAPHDGVVAERDHVKRAGPAGDAGARRVP